MASKYAYDCRTWVSLSGQAEQRDEIQGCELSAAVQEVEEYGIGQGLNSIEFGLRLRYEISRKFAPYIGIGWSRKLGETADFAEAEGEDTSVFSTIAGIRWWF